MTSSDSSKQATRKRGDASGQISFASSRSATRLARWLARTARSLLSPLRLVNRCRLADEDPSKSVCHWNNIWQARSPPPVSEEGATMLRTSTTACPNDPCRDYDLSCYPPNTCCQIRKKEVEASDSAVRPRGVGPFSKKRRSKKLQFSKRRRKSRRQRIVLWLSSWCYHRWGFRGVVVAIVVSMMRFLN
jgi:hypothetical protein